MADHMREGLVIDTLRMAVRRRRPDPGVIHHSDKGSQYVSLGFGQACTRAGISRSMGSVGDCYDNAVAETFFATLKKELVYRVAHGRPARSCARRCSSTSRGSTTAAGGTRRSGCCHPPTTRSSGRPARGHARAENVNNVNGLLKTLRVSNSYYNDHVND